MHAKARHTVFLLCCLTIIAACAPQFTPSHNPPLAPPELKTASFISFDGTELPLQSWLPAGGMDAAGSILIAVHGFNDYANFIRRGAEFFSSRDIAVFAYDQRGFGRAPGHGRWSSTGAMTEDLRTLVRLLAQQYPETPLFLLGHSMGAAVVIKAMAGTSHPDVAGAVLVAPAVWARTTMHFYQRGALWLAAHTIPWYTVTGEILHRKACSDDVALRELGRDPLVIRETRFDTIYGLQDLMDAAYAAADRYDLRTLVLYGRHDEIIPREPVLAVFHHFPAAEGRGKKLIIYENGYHMLLRDLQREKVMQDILAWVNGGDGGS